jgi:hypothetical protein
MSIAFINIGVFCLSNCFTYFHLKASQFKRLIDMISIVIPPSLSYSQVATSFKAIGHNHKVLVKCITIQQSNKITQEPISWLYQAERERGLSQAAIFRGI